MSERIEDTASTLILTPAHMKAMEQAGFRLGDDNPATWLVSRIRLLESALEETNGGVENLAAIEWFFTPQTAEPAEVPVAIERWAESIPDQLRAADVVFGDVGDVDHTAAILQALSCLDDHTRTDSARMEGARLALRVALGVRQ
jgi:hypothetical protein